MRKVGSETSAVKRVVIPKQEYRASQKPDMQSSARRPTPLLVFCDCVQQIGTTVFQIVYGQMPRLPSVFALVGVTFAGSASAQDQHAVRFAGAELSIEAAPAVVVPMLADALMLEEGDQLAFLHVELDEGWKTYWRAPGRFGLEPSFDWSHSGNLLNVRVAFPAPQLFDEADGQSIGYTNDTIWPVVLTPYDADQPIDVDLSFTIGLCEVLCVPASGALRINLGTDVAASPPDGSSLSGYLTLLSRLPVVVDDLTMGTADVLDRFWILERFDGHASKVWNTMPSAETLSHIPRPINLLEVVPGRSVRVQAFPSHSGG
ncbi:MAG: protein-disulfide reductase DsbD domain-containing protein [Pseudomonadota bacterium]